MVHIQAKFNCIDMPTTSVNLDEIIKTFDEASNNMWDFTVSSKMAWVIGMSINLGWECPLAYRSAMSSVALMRTADKFKCKSFTRRGVTFPSYVSDVHRLRIPHLEVLASIGLGGDWNWPEFPEIHLAISQYVRADAKKAVRPITESSRIDKMQLWLQTVGMLIMAEYLVNGSVLLKDVIGFTQDLMHRFIRMPTSILADTQTVYYVGDVDAIYTSIVNNVNVQLCRDVLVCEITHMAAATFHTSYWVEPHYECLQY